MSAARCIKLALLLSLLPLALGATSLLLGVPATASSRHGGSSRTSTVAVSARTARGRDDGRPYHRHATYTSGGGSGTRRLRQADDWFEDDKRLAPTGSNPLHNLR